MLFPDPKKTSEELSSQLIELSNPSLLNKGSKPVLVVMGTRSGNEIRSEIQSASMIDVARWGISFLYRTCHRLLGAFYLFFKSIFVHPAQITNGRED